VKCHSLAALVSHWTPSFLWLVLEDLGKRTRKENKKLQQAMVLTALRYFLHLVLTKTFFHFKSCPILANLDC
jgi:hypothetical protein